MALLDAHIWCYYHIQNPQKSAFVKLDYMQISGWNSRILEFDYSIFFIDISTMWHIYITICCVSD